MKNFLFFIKVSIILVLIIVSLVVYLFLRDVNFSLNRAYFNVKKMFLLWHIDENNVEQSFVSIKGDFSSGKGFLADYEGHKVIITSANVIVGNTKFKCIDSQQNVINIKSILIPKTDSNLVVLPINKPSNTLSFLSLSDKNQITYGMSVITFGGETRNVELCCGEVLNIQPVSFDIKMAIVALQEEAERERSLREEEIEEEKPPSKGRFEKTFSQFTVDPEEEAERIAGEKIAEYKKKEALKKTLQDGNNLNMIGPPDYNGTPIIDINGNIVGVLTSVNTSLCGDRFPSFSTLKNIDWSKYLETMNKIREYGDQLYNLDAATGKSYKKATDFYNILLFNQERLKGMTMVNVRRSSKLSNTTGMKQRSIILRLSTLRNKLKTIKGNTTLPLLHNAINNIIKIGDEEHEKYQNSRQISGFKKAKSTTLRGL